MAVLPIFQIHTVLLVLILWTLLYTTHASPSNTTLTFGPPYQCLENRPVPFTPEGGSPNNCAKAIIDAFPMSSTKVWFRDDGIGPFSLPRTAVVGDCEVSAKLKVAGVPVQRAWIEFWTMANTLTAACVIYSDPVRVASATTGGWIESDRLRVEIGRPKDAGTAKTE